MTPVGERRIVNFHAHRAGHDLGRDVGHLMIAERQKWRVQVLDESESSVGGLKEAVMLIEGDGVFSRMKHESGVHRVQRVPATETQGRIHTSAQNVAG